MALSIGTLLGPYRILAPIGAGGMGEVYKATDTRLGRTVAVKVLNNRFSQRFENEARAISTLNHPHVCTLYDIGSNYLVMEYLEGVPLIGPLPEEEALRLAIQIASALEAAHGKGIIHRDLKPGNILVTRSGVKLLDFGLAKLTSSEHGDIKQTIEGALIGTVAYMSPEQTEGQPLDLRSDIFSFGAVLYEMLSGRRAFNGTSSASLMSAILRDDPAPFKASPGLKQIVTRCLAKRPAERFQTIGEVRVALEQVISKPAGQQPSIAVLPFANLSAVQDDEYFSDGLAEEILNALSHTPGLKVIARTSAFAFKGKNEDVRKIAEMLGVCYILEGSVRRAGSRLRVTAQLIDAADGSHSWSERYDRELADVFLVQDEIASSICEALRLKLSHAVPEARHRPNLAAYEAYLKGWHHYWKATPESFARAREYFDNAIALDPGYALTHHGLGTLYFALAYHGLQPAHDVMPLARSAALTALNLDAALPEAHALLGVVAATYDYDWEEAGRQFRLATAAVPESAAVHFHHTAMYLLPLGLLREAIGEMQKALEQDPLNVVYRIVLAYSLDAAGMPELAITEAQKALEIDENHWSVHAMVGRTYASSGKMEEAISSTERAFQLSPWSPMVIGLLGGLHFRAGHKDRAQMLVQRLTELPVHRLSIGMAQYHLACGELEAAADSVEEAIEQRALFVIYYLAGPLKTLRDSPRWPKLAKLIHLPEMNLPETV